MQALFHSAEIVPSHSPTLNHETPCSSNDSFRERSEMIHIKNRNYSNHNPFICLDQTRTSVHVQIIWDKILVVFPGWFSSPAPLRYHPSSSGLLEDLCSYLCQKSNLAWVLMLMEERLRRWNLTVVCCLDARKRGCCCEEGFSSSLSRRGNAKTGGMGRRGRVHVVSWMK